MLVNAQKRLFSCVMHFFLNLIADGQKIAKKLCTQITKETKRVKALLDEYHACHVVDPSLCELSLSQALDPIFVRTLLTSLSDVATAVTAEKLEAIQAYLMVSRSHEEVAMLKEDAKNVVSYYNRKNMPFNLQYRHWKQIQTPIVGVALRCCIFC